MVTSRFSFSCRVFKRHVLQTRKTQGLFGKGLTWLAVVVAVYCDWCLIPANFQSSTCSYNYLMDIFVLSYKQLFTLMSINDIFFLTRHHIWFQEKCQLDHKYVLCSKHVKCWNTYSILFLYLSVNSIFDFNFSFFKRLLNIQTFFFCIFCSFYP